MPHHLLWPANAGPGVNGVPLNGDPHLADKASLDGHLKVTRLVTLGMNDRNLHGDPLLKDLTEGQDHQEHLPTTDLRAQQPPTPPFLDPNEAWEHPGTEATHETHPELKTSLASLGAMLAAAQGSADASWQDIAATVRHLETHMATEELGQQSRREILELTQRAESLRAELSSTTSRLALLAHPKPHDAPSTDRLQVVTGGSPGQPVITNGANSTAETGGTPPTEHSSPWRYGRPLRYIAALALLLLALWTVVIPGIFPVSSHAAVNARLLTIRSPIDGTSARPSKAVGDAVTAGEIVASIRNDRVDTSRLDSLTTQRTNLMARLDAQTQDQESRRREADQCRAVVEDFLRRSRTDLAQRLLEAKAAATRATTIALTQDSGVARLQEILDRTPGGISASEWERAVSTRDQARLDAVMAKTLVERATSQIAAVEAHQFVGLQAPYQVERLVQLESLIADLEVKGVEVRRNLTDLGQEMTKETQRVERLREAVLTSSNDGLVWKIQANAGQFIPLGAEVLQLAEGGTIAVEAWLHQRYLGDAEVGDRAIAYLTGERRRMEGTVTAVDVQGQTTADETKAYALPADSPKSFKVTIQLDRSPYTTAMIGQRAKVLLCGKSTGVGASFLLWFYALVEF